MIKKSPYSGCIIQFGISTMYFLPILDLGPCFTINNINKPNTEENNENKISTKESDYVNQSMQLLSATKVWPVYSFSGLVDNICSILSLIFSNSLWDNISTNKESGEVLTEIEKSTN